MNRDRVASEKLLKSLEGEGFKAIFLTVDAAVPGKRELDQRAKGDFSVRKLAACQTEKCLRPSLVSTGSRTWKISGGNRSRRRTCEINTAEG